MYWHVIAAFAVALIPIVVTPGTSAVLVTQYVAIGGRRQGVAVMAGTATGHYVHAAFAAAGLSALVMASATAFAIVKYLGAAYLVGLGVYMLVTATRSPTRTNAQAASRRTRQVYGEAVVGNVLNPKAALVYLTLPAQFIAAGQSVVVPVFILATIHTVMMVSWLSIWVQLIASVKRTSFFARFTRTVKSAGGVMLIALGLRSAVTP